MTRLQPAVVAEDTFWLNLRRTSHESKKLPAFRIYHQIILDVDLISVKLHPISNLLQSASQQPAVVSENSLQNVTCKWFSAEPSQFKS